jgi:hypothetical protein
MKNRIAVAISGSLVLRTYFTEPIRRIEPSSHPRRHLEGQGYSNLYLGVPDMPKAARISVPVPASTASSEKSGSGALVSIALFSAIGLLVSLVAILLGVPGVWY